MSANEALQTILVEVEGDHSCVVAKYLLTVKASFRIMRKMETASIPTSFLFQCQGSRPTHQAAGNSFR